MGNEIIGKVRIILPAGKATPAPPVSTILGPRGLQLKQFCDVFNEKTKGMKGNVTAIVKILGNKTMEISVIGESVSSLIKQKMGILKGAQKPGIEEAKKISLQQIKEIAEEKMKDSNVNSIEGMIKSVIGTAKSMGIEVEG